METASAKPLKNYYLKGNSRHWFWPLMAFAVLSVVFGTYINVYHTGLLAAGLENVSPVSVYLSAGLQSFVICAGWAFFYLMYGVNNKVGAYKTLFVIRALLQLPLMVSSFISTPVVQRLSFPDQSTIINIIASIIYFALIIYDVVFFAVIAFGKSANSLLKMASLIGAVLALLDIAKNVSIFYFTTDLVESLGSNGYAAVFGIANTLLLVSGLVGTGLFFGAMSFSARPSGSPSILNDPKV
jgi:hypothetical protein